MVCNFYGVESFLMEMIAMRMNGVMRMLVLVIMMVSIYVMMGSIDYMCIQDVSKFMVFMMLFIFVMMIFIMTRDFMILFMM
jgi:NADH:ubiquinone oxidoreductase subunit 5 (subunit L)/multisubunit Na+/H+ antiporter MnhA subunit